MGVHVIKVPDVGEGIAEVELVSWSVSIGDTVRRNQILAEVMTDKANVEIPSPSDGVIAGLTGAVGEILAVGSPLIEMTVEADRTSSRPDIDDVRLSLSVSTTPPSDEGGSPAGAGPARDSTVPISSAVANIVADTSQQPSPEPGAEAEPDDGDVDRTRVFVASDHGIEAGPVTNPLIDRGRSAGGPASGGTGSNPLIGTESAPRPSEPVRRQEPEATSAAAAARTSSSLRPNGERPLATPSVRHKAREAGIDLRDVPATGPAGRITHADLDAYDPHRVHNGSADGAPAGHDAASGSATSAAAGRPDLRVETEPIIGIRRQIARRMLASTQSIPHITYVDEVDVTALEDLRATLNGEAGDGAPRLTLLPFLIRAMVDAIARFPQMNAHVDDETETLTTYGGVHVGIATQTANGLVVPVIRHAEASSLWALAARIDEAATTARAGRAAPADLSGSTITISSLGALGGLVTTPVLNKPEVAIVGVNKIVTRPVFTDPAAGAAGGIVARKMMNLSSSFDHRIVDGWDAASFIQRIKTTLESPALLFVEPPATGSFGTGSSSTGSTGTGSSDAAASDPGEAGTAEPAMQLSAATSGAGVAGPGLWSRPDRA